MADASYPDDLKYHAEHDWARIDGDTATLGHHLVRPGPARRGRLLRPAGGRHDDHEGHPVRRGRVRQGRLRRDRAAVSGEIVEVNEALKDSPEQINDDSYGEGWLVKIKLSDPSEADSLMDAESYQEQPVIS